MADIATDEFEKQDILRRFKLDITRLNTQKEELEYKLFSFQKEKARLEGSIRDIEKAILERQAELDKHRKEFGM